MSHGIGVFTSVCEEDRHWIPQYLREVQRLKLMFAVHLDRCSDATKRLITCHPRCVGYTEQTDHTIEFNEMHKQAMFDLIVKQKFKWAFAWDIDETFERETPRKLEALARTEHALICTWWYNLWNDRHHVRVDGLFGSGKRAKMYNLNFRGWEFTNAVVNGAKLKGIHFQAYQSDLVCLHHGMMTQESRRMHKERWDRIYSTALRGDPNPYGFWKWAIESQGEAVVVKHAYF